MSDDADEVVPRAVSRGRRGTPGIVRGDADMDDDENDATPQERDELDDLLSILPDARVVVVYKHNEATAQFAYLNRMHLPPDVSLEYVLDRIQRNHGGGYYQLKFRGSGEKYLKSKNLYIDPLPEAKDSPVLPDARSDVAEVVRALRSTEDDRRLERLESILAQSQQRPQRDIVETITAIAPVVTQLLSVLIAAKGQAQPVAVAAPDPAALAEKMMRQFTTGVKVGRDIGRGEVPDEGPRDEPAPYTALIPIADRVMTVIEKAASAPTGTPPTTTTPTMMRQARPTPTVATPKTSEEWVTMMRLVVPEILHHARHARDPIQKASDAWDRIEGTRYESVVREACTMPNFVGLCYLHFPALASHREWVDEFLGAIKEFALGNYEYVEEDEGEGEDAALDRQRTEVESRTIGVIPTRPTPPEGEAD